MAPAESTRFDHSSSFPMIRDHKVPAGPRPANYSPTRNRSREISSPTKRLHTKRSSVTASPPMLSASSSNNHSLFSFGHTGQNGQGAGAVSSPITVEPDTSTPYAFLPEVSFDDFQTSIESASSDLELTQFPSPTGEGSILEAHGFGNSRMVERPNTYRAGASARAPIQQGQQQDSQAQAARSRVGPIFRRPSVSNRQTSISSTASTTSRTSDTTSRDQSTIRPRRQNQHPPVSNSGFVGKQPRRSIGTGVFDSTAESGNGTGVRRRPSLSSMDRPGVDSSTRSSIDGGNRYPDTSRNMTASRTAKLKTLSAPPPNRISQGSASADSTLSPDQSSASPMAPRSPRAGKSGATTPASGRRMSVVPGHPSHHASGLGARTISPTDTQRLKRRSFMPDPQSSEAQLNTAILQPPLLPPDRPASRSPSMLPRKTSTPSSQRTTPDPNRKSHSSISIASMTSTNTVRTSTGSLQPRVPQASNSRLPAPKLMTNNLPVSNDEDEDVPPVPAIPKVYESPKESPAELVLLDKRKSNLGLDSSSMRSTSTGSLSGPAVHEKPRAQHKPSKVGQNASIDPEKKPQPERAQASQPRRNFKSMNLPPLTVGPLSTPTVNKIARLQQSPAHGERKISSPPARQTAKTPSTPMTASRSTFFPKRKELAHYRSSSSIHQPQRMDSPLAELADTSSAESVSGSIVKPSVSPYLSSSVPKEGGFEQAYFKRSQTGSDMREVEEPVTSTAPQSKPSGPRAQRQPSKSISKVSTKSNPKSPVQQQSSPEDPPQTPSSMTTLRRKLSLSWKRSSSKTEKHPENANTKHDAMPPPRIPISATTGNSGAHKTGSPSMSSKSSGLQSDAVRRKVSGTSLNSANASAQPHGRNKSDASSGTATQHAAGRPVRGDSSNASSTSVMQKFLRSKASTNKIQQSDTGFTADLDKDDLTAEEEMKKLGSRRRETELAAKTLDTLRKRATPKERVSPQDAIRIAMLNIYERGEIIDYKDIFFCGTQNAKKVVGDLHSKAPNFGYDDERGDYTIVIGDHLAYRYEIVDVLGKGSFGQVVRCIDHKTGVLVAVKIIRNKKRFHQQALVEVNILQKLREWDPKNRHSMVNFTHSFYFREHLCISTELLDMNLYEFIKANAFRGFSLKMIRRFTKQMLSSLNLLKQKKVIHCDLKPENILLRHPMHTELKVIDFGSSCFENEKVYTYIQSRFYRSPEVILGMSYGLPIDMWSLGCILAELYTGVPIFPGENEQEQLACIMEVFGPPEKHLIEKSTRKKLFFDSMGKPRLTVSSKGCRRRPSSKTLQQALKCDNDAFLDFIARCLRWDPDRRMKPEEAIRHEFITGQKMPAPALRMATVREQSPIKRHNTISTPRPLPEPPAAAPSMRVSSNLRPIKDTSGVLGSGSSPLKSSTGTTTHSRRPSGVYTIPPKRTSAGPAPGLGSSLSSNLPRAAARSVSSKQDLASAGATAAMANRRA